MVFIPKNGFGSELHDSCSVTPFLCKACCKDTEITVTAKQYFSTYCLLSYILKNEVFCKCWILTLKGNKPAHRHTNTHGEYGVKYNKMPCCRRENRAMPLVSKQRHRACGYSGTCLFITTTPSLLFSKF